MKGIKILNILHSSIRLQTSMSVSQAQDNVDRAQPEDSQEEKAGGYQGGAAGGPREGGAGGSQAGGVKQNIFYVISVISDEDLAPSF